MAVSILCFGVLWAVVFVQMATGNDPVLSAKAQPAASKRRGPAAHRSANEALEPTPAEPEVVEEPEAAFEEPEVVEEPEVEFEEPEVVEEAELEPLTTSQS